MGTGDPEEDWSVACSDDESYGKDGVWEPDTSEIIQLYEKLSKGETVSLEWQAPERRSPQEDVCGDDDDGEDEVPEAEKPEMQVPTEFDFDDDMSVANAAITPRRTPGSKTPRRTEKRVARMDKIMSDIMRHKRIDKQAKQQHMLHRQQQHTPIQQLQTPVQQQQMPQQPSQAVLQQPLTGEAGVADVKTEVVTPPPGEQPEIDADGTPVRPLAKLKIRKDLIT